MSLEQDLGSIYLKCKILLPSGGLSIFGELRKPGPAKLFAACPIQRRSSYLGSAMPYANRDQAFENTPNVFDIEGSIFTTTFTYPNSYYLPDGCSKVPPSLFVAFPDGEVVQMILPDPYELRTMTHRPETRDPSFYTVRAEQLGVQSQEALIKTYAKPYLY